MIVAEECSENVTCLFPCGKLAAVEIRNSRGLAEVAFNLRLENIILVAVGLVTLNAVESLICLGFSEKLIFLGNRHSAAARAAPKIHSFPQAPLQSFCTIQADPRGQHRNMTLSDPHKDYDCQ